MGCARCKLENKSFDTKATALLIAAGNNQLEAVKYLIKAGADLNAKTGDGYSAEELAEQKGFAEVANYLKSIK